MTSTQTPYSGSVAPAATAGAAETPSRGLGIIILVAAGGAGLSSIATWV